MDATGASFGRDVVSLTTIRLVAVVGAGFLTSVLAARLLGPDELGLAGVALTLGTSAALVANGGVSMATIYLLRQSPAEIRHVIAALMGLSLTSLVLAAVTGSVLSVVVGWIAVPGVLGAAALSAGLLAAATVAADTASAQLLGLGLTRGYAISEAIRGLAILVATALVLIVLATPAGYVVGTAVGLFAATTYAQLQAHQLTEVTRPVLDRRLWRMALRYGLRGQAGNVLQYFSLRLDLVLVAAILGPAPAGVYLIATRVSEVVTQVANAAASLLFPAVAGRAENASTDLTAATIRVVIAAVVLSSMVLGIAAWVLLPVVFGQRFAAGLPALWLLLVAALPLSVGRLLAGDLKGRGRPGIVSVVGIVGLAITIVADLALLGPLGIEGAAFASILAYGANAIGLALAYRAETGAPLGALIPRRADLATIWRMAATVASRRSRPRDAS